MAALLQLLITGIWASALVIHTRRLFRLARVTQLRRWDGVRWRSGLNRLWWWLGQDEFWHDVRADGMRCVQLTCMIFLLAWGLSM